MSQYFSPTIIISDIKNARNKLNRPDVLQSSCITQYRHNSEKKDQRRKQAQDSSAVKISQSNAARRRVFRTENTGYQIAAQCKKGQNAALR
jgi:hypothetical protein